MKSPTNSVAALVAGLAMSSAALTQTFEPQVRRPLPAPQQQRPDITGVFAESYRKAGSPRIAIYWNRQLSDNLASNYQQFDKRVSTSNGSETESEDATNTSFGSSLLREKDDSRRDVEERTSGSRLTNADAARAQADETTAWRLESSFYDPLLSSGVRLIDRNLIMRTLNKGASQGATPDIQSVETQALLGKVDYLLEVLMTSDNGSPIGCRFRITIKDVNTGEIVGLMSTRAMPEVSRTSRFVATQGGFKRETTTEVPSLEDFAHRLAEETMFQLARGWELQSTRPREI